MKSREEYLKSVDGWADRFDGPIINHYNGITVVRDDILDVGSKVRFLDYLIGHDPKYYNIKEWVFGSCPATGYAQISLPAVCSHYSKKAVLFMAARSIDKLHPFQKKGVTLGAQYNWVPNGMLPVTQKRARDYVAANPNERALLPIGLEHDTVIGSIISIASNLFPLKHPDYVWTVGSSGTLNRGLQLAFPEAECHVVSVGHKMSEREVGRAIFHRSKYRFDQAVKEHEKPPFNSVSTYDAKGWLPMLEWKEKENPVGDILFWNVAGD